MCATALTVPTAAIRLRAATIARPPGRMMGCQRLNPNRSALSRTFEAPHFYERPYISAHMPGGIYMDWQLGVGRDA